MDLGFEKSGITHARRSDFTVDDNPFADLVSIYISSYPYL